MVKCIIAAHRSDLDGIASHAIFQRYLNGKNPVHVFVEYDTVEKDFKKINTLAEVGTEIYVADFNINESKEEKILPILEELHKKKCKIFWYDHHEWKSNVGKIRKDVTELVIDTDKCGAQLACKRFMKGDRFTEKLAEIAADYDLWIRKKLLSFKLSLLIKNRVEDEEKLMEIVNTFADGKIWRREWKAEYEPLKKEYDKQMKKVLKTVMEYQIKDKIVVVIYVDSKVVSNSEAGEIGVKKERRENHLKPADVIAIVNPTGKVSLRRKKKDSGVPLDEVVANELEGGGHPYAASGKISLNETALAKGKILLRSGTLLHAIEKYC